MTDRTRTVRSTTALIAAAALALASAGVLVLATAERASAVSLQVTTPEYTLFTSTSGILEGTANPGDDILVNLGGAGPDCTTTADGSGNWSCSLTFTRSAYTVFTASRADDGDPLFQDSEGWEYYVNIPPTLTTPANGALINDRTPTVSGGGAASGETVNVGAGASGCSAVADAAGNWSCDVAADMGPDGNYIVAAEHAPSYTASASGLVTALVTLDTTQPVTPTIMWPVDTSTPGLEYTATSDLTPTIYGIGEMGATVYVTYGPSELFGSIVTLCSDVVNSTVNGDPYFFCDSPVTFTPGTHTVLSVYSIDAAGNTGPSPDPEVRIDFVAPPGPVTVTTPAPGYRAVNPYVYVSGPPAGNPVTVTDGEGSVCTVVTTASGWSCTIGPLSPRQYNFGVFVTDIYGTSSPGTSIEFDILAPTPPASSTPTPTPTPTPTAPPLPIDVTLTVTDLEGNDITGQPIVAGQTVVLTASGLPTGATVTAELHSDPIVLGTKSVGNDGMFTMTSVIPRTVPPGDHSFVVAVEAPGYAPTTAQTAVPILAPPPEKATEQVDKEAVLALLAAEEEALRTGDFTAPTSFTNTLQTVADVRITATTLGIAGLVASAFLLLVAFPAELLEGTIRANYRRLFWWMDPVAQRFAKVREVAAARINRWVGTIGIIAGTAVVLGFADPGFGFNGASLRLWMALVISIVLLNVVVSSIVMSVAERRFRIGSTLEPMPAALLLVAASVIVSRLAGIQPGLLFSIVLGIAFAYELSRRQDALLTMLGVGLSIAIGVAAWLGYSALAATGGDDPGFWHLLAQEILAATTVEALATMVIALLPLDFLDGKSLFQWNKWAWAGIYVVAIVTFVIIILPLANNWGEATAPFLGWGALFGGFAAFAVLAWALLRYIPARRGVEAADGETVEREKIDA